MTSEMSDEILSVLAAQDAEVSQTGSRYICTPAPTDTDDDYLVVLPSPSKMADLISALEEHGFSWDHGDEYDGDGESTFASYRLGKLNLICTHSPDFAVKHRAATHVCKALNLLQKPQRVMVFQAVLYANQYSPEV